MDLILWRHADATADGEDGDDLSRPLTARGARQAERMAGWLNERLADSTRILVSPALRCRQTAKALGRRSSIVAGLAPGASAETLLQLAGWPDAAGSVLVVGHQPTLGLVASLVLEGIARSRSIRKAAVWWFRQRPRDADSQGAWHAVLHAVQSPEDL
ncbi:MAG TPA: histidine phosphatase family protein [Caldimonas sp.]|nr:histidine phosphatase family protein [Caldimonas sp.]